MKVIRNSRRRVLKGLGRASAELATDAVGGGVDPAVDVAGLAVCVVEGLAEGLDGGVVEGDVAGFDGGVGGGWGGDGEEGEGDDEEGFGELHCGGCGVRGWRKRSLGGLYILILSCHQVLDPSVALRHKAKLSRLAT
ncbi:hypothetical protein V496_01787 [Pseudogymnoascus sp. VKM F-4515 (FW-2607)]|nr:hypothetical protein V496_01787 [Pseudogymnoascus sp. VKM F-4515 (FW-2607)]